MRKECMSLCFSFSSQKQRISGETVVMTYDFPHVQQQLTNKMEDDHQQAIIEIQREHQLAINYRVTESKPFNMKTWISRVT